MALMLLMRRSGLLPFAKNATSPTSRATSRPPAPPGPAYIKLAQRDDHISRANDCLEPQKIQRAVAACLFEDKPMPKLTDQHAAS